MSQAPVYKLYYTDVPQHTTPNLTMLVPLQFATREQTIAAAQRAKKAAHVVWRIEEPDGGGFDRAAVEAALRGDLQFNTSQQGRIIVDPRSATRPTMTSTGGMPHKQHERRNTQVPKRPTR